MAIKTEMNVKHLVRISILEYYTAVQMVVCQKIKHTLLEETWLRGASPTWDIWPPLANSLKIEYIRNQKEKKTNSHIQATNQKKKRKLWSVLKRKEEPSVLSLHHDNLLLQTLIVPTLNNSHTFAFPAALNYLMPMEQDQANVGKKTR